MKLDRLGLDRLDETQAERGSLAVVGGTSTSADEDTARARLRQLVGRMHPSLMIRTLADRPR